MLCTQISFPILNLNPQLPRLVFPPDYSTVRLESQTQHGQIHSLDISLPSLLPDHPPGLSYPNNGAATHLVNPAKCFGAIYLMSPGIGAQILPQGTNRSEPMGAE